MAFLPTQFNQQDEQENQQNQYQQQLGSYLSGLGAQGGQQPQQQKKPATSGQFTNVQQLRDINKQAGQQLASRMGSIVGRDVGQARSGIQNVREAVEQTRGSKQQFTEGAQQVKQAVEQSRAGNIEDLVNLTSDQNLNRFYRITQGETDLPELTQKFGQAASQFGATLGQAQANLETELGTELGRFGLTRRAVKSPLYSKGQQTLDQIIAQSAGGDVLKQTLGQERSNIGQSWQEKGQLTQEQTSLANQYLDLAKQTRQELQQFITETEGLTKEEIEKREQDYLKKIKNYEDMARKILTGDLELKTLGSWLAGQEGVLKPQDFDLFQQVSLADEEVPEVLVRDLSKIGLKEEDFLNLYLKDLFISPTEAYKQRTGSYSSDPMLRGIRISDKFSNPQQQQFFKSLKQDILSSKVGTDIQNEIAELKNKNPQLRNLYAQYNKYKGRPVFDSWEISQKQQLSDEIKKIEFEIENQVISKNLPKIQETAKQLLSEKRKTTLEDREYQQALADKFLRENFGLDTSTRIYGTDLASLVNVDRSNLQERVRTQKETAQLNALRRLMEGQQAAQLATEGVEQSIQDVINRPRIQQELKKGIDKGLADFLESLKQSGQITGQGKASESRGFGMWRDHYASTTLNPFEYFMSQNKDALQTTLQGMDSSALEQLVSRGILTSVNPALNFIPGAANFVADVLNQTIGRTILGADDPNEVKRLAQQRAIWDALDKYNRQLDRLQYNRRIKFRG